MSEVGLECKLARNYTLENVPDALAYLLIKVVPNPAVNFGSLPMNLGLLIDVSRSMRGKKIKCAREAAKFAVQSLQPDDWVSVTIFSDEAEAVVANTRACEKDLILSSIDKIRIMGGTRMYHGMEVGVRAMRKAGFSGTINRMIILTDGMTEGEEQCRFIADQEVENKLVISPFGIGDKYNEELLKEISDTTLGTFYHLQTPQQITEQFQRELGAASAAVISNVTLSINLVEDVKLEELYRIFPSSVRLQPKIEADGKIVSTEVGNLRKDELTCFGAQLRLAARPAGRVRIAQIFVAYSVPSLQIEDNIEKTDAIVRYTGDHDLCGRIDREVIGYFNQINVQNLIEQAIKETKVGNIPEATQILAQAQVITQRIGNVVLTRSIEQATEELRKKGTISSGAMKTVRAGGGHTVRIEKTDMV